MIRLWKDHFLLPLMLLVTVSTCMETGFARLMDHSGPAEKDVLKAAQQLFNGKNLDGWYTFIQGRDEIMILTRSSQYRMVWFAYQVRNLDASPQIMNLKITSFWWSSNGEIVLIHPESIMPGIAGCCCIPLVKTGFFRNMDVFNWVSDHRRRHRWLYCGWRRQQKVFLNLPGCSGAAGWFLCLPAFR